MAEKLTKAAKALARTQAAGMFGLAAAALQRGYYEGKAKAIRNKKLFVDPSNYDKKTQADVKRAYRKHKSKY